MINQKEKNKSKNIVLAPHAGFCYGVKRAVDTTIKLKKQNKDINVCVLGELIHNSHVISKLENLGIKTLMELPEKGEGYCVIRSHGESQNVFDKIKSLGFELVDLTCFDVKKVQKKAAELALEGFFVIILGKYEHPEVKAIREDAQAIAENKNNIFVASDINALKENEQLIKKAHKVGVVLQTTQTKEFLFSAINYLSGIVKILKVQNTICPSTSLRQEEAKTLANQSDLMIVVGSKKSANTTHLANLLTKITKTIHIEQEKELDNYKDLILSSKNIGVTAGASTPDDLIKNVMNKLERIN